MTRKPKVMMVSKAAYSMIEVMRMFAGRDWRRIKRELRKAEERSK